MAASTHRTLGDLQELLLRLESEKGDFEFKVRRLRRNINALKRSIEIIAKKHNIDVSDYL